MTKITVSVDLNFEDLGQLYTFFKPVYDSCVGQLSILVDSKGHNWKGILKPEEVRGITGPINVFGKIINAMAEMELIPPEVQQIHGYSRTSLVKRVNRMVRQKEEMDLQVAKDQMNRENAEFERVLVGDVDMSDFTANLAKVFSHEEETTTIIHHHDPITGEASPSAVSSSAAELAKKYPLTDEERKRHLNKKLN